MIHPRSRVKGSAILTSRPGRVRAGPDGRNVSAMSPHTEPKEVEAGRFAQSLSQLLRCGRHRGSFEQVAIAAPPHFLGLLRDQLDGRVRKCLVACLPKDYTLTPSQDLPPLLEGVRRAASRA